MYILLIALKSIDQRGENEFVPEGCALGRRKGQGPTFMGSDFVEEGNDEFRFGKVRGGE